MSQRSFEEITAEISPLIEAALGDCLQFGEGCPPLLAEAIRYVVLGPGKRFRPILVLLACRACGGDQLAALPAACAVELVHAYSLVHDDLPAMDNDDFRRGRPTCHRVYGEGLAILVGDALLARAFELLAQRISPPSVAVECCLTLAQAAGAENLVGGQADDLAATGCICRGEVTWESMPASTGTRLARTPSPAGQGSLSDHRVSGQELAQLVRSIHRRKTAAMIRASVRLGGLIGRGSPEQLAALELYGEKLGLAFQIVDDILDASGSRISLGKTPGKDQKQGKLTYPAVFGVVTSREHAAALIHEACQALVVFGQAANDLITVAQFVLERRR
ncbi:MAG: polyprenyl synthetase family protein [Thermoguttaceae bacterium]|nr:polyprenyl synthetase family protein [Thermoguttaceae bacterium]MDW8077921.1 polyprenyl synthetase family protein [Thermoguttaceae bacterium]